MIVSNLWLSLKALLDSKLFHKLFRKEETENYFNNLVYIQIHYKLFNK